MKSFVLVVGMVMMLVASWEYSKADPVLAEAQAISDSTIPAESIRLRILADSDAPADQALKRRVRDAVIASMNEWATGPQTIEEARETIRERLPEIERLTADMAAEAGFAYSAKAELGLVPFPTKVYDGKLYPAGDYEALRITIGRGLGQNWWCVLFPPLCFVDVASGETPNAAGVSTVMAASAVVSADKAGAGGDAAADDADAANGEDEAKVEYRFFLLELISDLVNAVRGWFGA
ncbi:stage II sporulation protein R [Paenibacillus antri]|uniref:Stage II sporulation protein R n=2 Tax=Paenibacillus antri TaxID=2582848 RepID=A0A5R9GDB1_9BACL|nr:stage II sporulation protein R [Paenibacillus antri]